MLLGLLALLTLFTLLWLASLALKNASIVDIWWGLGFIVAAGAYLAATDGFQPRRALVMTLVVLWGVRLAWHIGSRNIGHGEDFRYAKWRAEQGARWWWYSYFKVFVLQAVVAWIVGLPLYFAIRAPEPAGLTLFDVVGVALFGVGFAFEAVGDWQLRQFKSNPDNKGKLMTSGLWRYTRHPNYFGDAMLWWGFGVIALGTPGGWASLVGPALINFFLVKVSGVALLEKTLVESKPGYREYVAATSAFLPRRPRPVRPS